VNARADAGGADDRVLAHKHVVSNVQREERAPALSSKVTVIHEAVLQTTNSDYGRRQHSTIAETKYR
jgi:hypothetical protein